MGLKTSIYRNLVCLFLSALGSFVMLSSRTSAEISSADKQDPLLGPRVDLGSDWVGSLEVSSSMHFLIMAGHADSQGISGAGTAGEAVAVNNLPPMNKSIKI